MENSNEKYLVFECEYCGEQVFADLKYAQENDWGVVSWRDSLESQHRVCEMNAEEEKLAEKISVDSYESVRDLLKGGGERIPKRIVDLIWGALKCIPKEHRKRALAGFLANLWGWFPEDAPIIVKDILYIYPNEYWGGWTLTVIYKDED